MKKETIDNLTEENDIYSGSYSSISGCVCMYVYLYHNNHKGYSMKVKRNMN